MRARVQEVAVSEARARGVNSRCEGKESVGPTLGTFAFQWSRHCHVKPIRISILYEHGEGGARATELIATVAPIDVR